MYVERTIVPVRRRMLQRCTIPL